MARGFLTILVDSVCVLDLVSSLIEVSGAKACSLHRSKQLLSLRPDFKLVADYDDTALVREKLDWG